MTKEVQKQESNAVANIDVDAFGGGGLSGADVVIPKILVMQGLSKQVTEGHAKFGDLVDSLSSQVVGNAVNAPLEFIPFLMEKQWVVFTKMNGIWKFNKFEPVTVANENKPWEEIINGVEYKNEKCFNFYSILPSDPSMPYVISFKATSQKTGRELATQMYVKNKAAGKVPPAFVMNLKGDKVTNDKGTYVVLKTEINRESTMDEIQNCLTWFKTIQSGGAKTDHSDVAPKQEEQQPQF